MKFSHSERTLHEDSHFTPACNYYNNPRPEHKTVLTGSLVGPTIQKQIPNFGLSARFGQKKDKIPGPGSYLNQKQKEHTNKSVKTGTVIRQYKKHGFLGGEGRSPSIPYSHFNPDKEEEECIKEIMMNEDLKKGTSATKKGYEGHTFSKSPRNLGKGHIQQYQQVQLERIAEYSERMINLGMKPKKNFQEQIKRTNQRRSEMINLMNPEFIPSLQLIEIITKRRTKYTPGPGFYNQDKQETKTEDTGSFSTSKRFSADKASVLGPGKYQVSSEHKKSITFSKSTRTLFNMKGDTDLEHRFYIDPYQNVKKREYVEVKGQNQPNSFGSQMARFYKLEKQAPLTVQTSRKGKIKSKIQSVVEMKLQRLHKLEKQSTRQSQGLLGISTMASTIQ